MHRQAGKLRANLDATEAQPIAGPASATAVRFRGGDL